MIIGIGTDIQSISKFEKKMHKETFLNLIFTKGELATLKNKKPKSYVGYFCAKEAMAKALGTGFVGFSPKDIEIHKTPTGKPYLKLLNNANVLSNSLNIEKINLSISHSDDYAVAFVICED